MNYPSRSQWKTNLDVFNINILLIKREGRTGRYRPEVLTVLTERSEVRTKKTSGRYSPEQAWLIRDLLYD